MKILKNRMKILKNSNQYKFNMIRIKKKICLKDNISFHFEYGGLYFGLDCQK